MPRGGHREGSGRKNGSIQGLSSLSKENQALVEAALASNAAYGESNANLPEDISPLDLLLHVVRNNDAPMNIRVSAATVAAPYMHPRLTSTKVTVQKENNLQEILDMVRNERKLNGEGAKVLEHAEVNQVDMFAQGAEKEKVSQGIPNGT